MSRYRYIRPLGQGATGQSYLAEDEKLQTRVVIKRFFHEHSRSKEREIHFLQKLSHPAIPSYIDSFVEEVDMVPRFHLVSEYVEGEPLRSQHVEPWSFASQIFPILEYLHSLEPPVIHRDIKPSNMIWTQDGILHLIDFGSAIHAQDSTLGHTIMAGTLGYQAPEQIEGSPVPASDLYAVGAVLVEILSGKSAFSMLRNQVLDWEDEVELPAIAVLWLRKLMHRDIAKRFTSAQEALFALEPVRNAVEAQPVTAAHHPRRWLTLFSKPVTQEIKEKWKGWVLLQERATKGSDWEVIASCWKLLGEEERYQLAKEKEREWKRQHLSKLEAELKGEGVTVDVDQLLARFSMKNLQERFTEDIENIRSLKDTSNFSNIRHAFQYLSRHYRESDLHIPCLKLEEGLGQEELRGLEEIYGELGFIQRRQHVRFIQKQRKKEESERVKNALEEFLVSFEFSHPIQSRQIAQAEQILKIQQELHEKATDLEQQYQQHDLVWTPLVRPYSTSEIRDRERLFKDQENLSSQWKKLRARAEEIHWSPKDILLTPVTIEVFQTALVQQEEYWHRIAAAEKRSNDTISWSPQRPQAPYEDPEEYEEAVQEQLMLHASLQLLYEQYPSAVHSLLSGPKPPYTQEAVEHYTKEANILASNRRAERLLQHRYRGLILAPILGVMLYIGFVQWNLQQEINTLRARFPDIGESIPHPSCVECPPLNWPSFPYQQYQIHAFHTYLLEHEQRLKRLDSLLGKAKEASIDIDDLGETPSLQQEVELQKKIEEQYVPVEELYLLQRDAQRLRIPSSDWKNPMTHKEFQIKKSQVERARILHEEARILQEGLSVPIPFVYPLTSTQLAIWKSRVERIPEVQKVFSQYKQVEHRIPYDLTALKREVDQELYTAVMEQNPSQYINIKRSVHNVDWFDAVQFADRLNWYLQKSSCYLFSSEDVRWIEGCSAWRLPTKNEWEALSKKEARGRIWGKNRFSIPQGGAFQGDYWELVWDRYEESLLSARPYIVGGSWLTPSNRKTRSIPLYGKAENISFRLVRGSVQGFPPQPDQQMRPVFETTSLSNDILLKKDAFRVLLERESNKEIRRRYAVYLEEKGLLAEAEEAYKQSGANLCMSIQLRRALDSVCDPFLLNDSNWLKKEKAGLAVLAKDYGNALRLMESCSQQDISCFFAKIRIMLMVGKQEKAKEEYCVLSSSQRKDTNIAITCEEFRIPIPGSRKDTD